MKIRMYWKSRTGQHSTAQLILYHNKNKIKKYKGYIYRIHRELNKYKGYIYRIHRELYGEFIERVT